MERDSKYLFVYGTLLNASNQFGLYLQNNSSHFAMGYFNGLLYDIGTYPGALYRPEIQQQVFGEIRLMNDPAALFNMLDDYEGIGPRHPQPHEFIRTIIPVNHPDGAVDCQVYLYNWPVDSSRQIASGRYQS